MIYYAVTIDTECDKGPRWLVRYPMAFRGIEVGIAEKLEPAFRERGVRATYLLSPEVLMQKTSTEILRDARAHGAELGTHLHGEFIEPDPDWNAEATYALQNTYPPEVEEAKLSNLTTMFTERFGVAPTSFRAGRYGIGKHSLPILAKLGYAVDSSVTPYCAWSDRGGSASFFGAPEEPYYPSKDDPIQPGSLPILEVPVTIGRTLLRKLSRSIVQGIPDRPKLWKLPYLFLKDQLRPVWLRPTWSTIDQMKEVAQERITSGGDTILVMMFHNVEAEAGCSPYAQTEEQAAEFMRRLCGILDYLNSIGAKSVGLTEIKGIVDAGSEDPNRGKL